MTRLFSRLGYALLIVFFGSVSLLLLGVAFAMAVNAHFGDALLAVAFVAIVDGLAIANLRQ